jgi:hypothetical protein
MIMDSTETRLRRAAAETREVASHAVPPGLGQEPMRGSGWLVLATAFAAVMLVFALPLLLGNRTQPPLGGPDSTIATATTEGVAPTTSVLDSPSDCSASGVPEPQLDPSLPEDVAAKAQAIVSFALECDLDGLAGVAGPRFLTSFGGGGIDDLAQWEDEGRGELDTLIRLFDTRHEVVGGGDGPEIYVWPAAFAYDTWEEIQEGDLAELREIYTEEELDEIAKFGSYAGWRIGIDENGVWLWFIAGD